MSATVSTTVAPTTRGGIPFPSPDPNRNQNPDPSTNGPSAYLYGFLATLVLIFLVSFGVAWKGYHTRRLLRARIDEAIARGVLIPGYDPDNPNLNLALFGASTFGERLRNAPVVPRPVMYEGWFGAPAEGLEDASVARGKWDIKPTSLDALQPYQPQPPKPPPSTFQAHSLVNQLLDPLRQYWFVQPPAGADANQLQGRPRSGRRGGATLQIAEGSDRLARLEQEQMEKKRSEESLGLYGVDEVVVSVLIVMPERRNSHNRYNMNGFGGVGEYAGVALGSRPSSSQYPHGVQGGCGASGSRPTSYCSYHPHLHPHTTVGNSTTPGVLVEEEKKADLPHLVFGVVSLWILPKSETAVGGERGVEVSGGNGGKAGREGKGNESEIHTPPTMMRTTATKTSAMPMVPAAETPTPM